MEDHQLWTKSVSILLPAVCFHSAMWWWSCNKVKTTWWIICVTLWGKGCCVFISLHEAEEKNVDVTNRNTVWNYKNEPQVLKQSVLTETWPEEMFSHQPQRLRRSEVESLFEEKTIMTPQSLWGQKWLACSVNACSQDGGCWWLSSATRPDTWPVVGTHLARDV